MQEAAINVPSPIITAMSLEIIDETIRRGIMTADGIRTNQLWLNNLGQLFTQLDATKIKKEI